MRKILCAVMASAVLAGCAAKGGGASVSHSVGSDASLQKSISEAWVKDHPKASAPTIAVSEGVVILTGTLDSAKDRIDALRAAWQPDGVMEVVNELEVADGLAKLSRRDRATTIKLRTRLTFDTDMISTHYSIETLNGTVYLMGIAHDDAELARVKQLAEDTVGKGKVVSYVQVKPTSAG